MTSILECQPLKTRPFRNQKKSHLASRLINYMSYRSIEMASYRRYMATSKFNHLLFLKPTGGSRDHCMLPNADHKLIAKFTAATDISKKHLVIAMRSEKKRCIALLSSPLEKSHGKTMEVPLINDFFVGIFVIPSTKKLEKSPTILIR